MKELLNKEYSGEDLNDVSRDVHESFNPDITPAGKDIPVDEYGFAQGTFKVTVEWIPE